MKPPVTVRIQYINAEVVLEVNGMYGTAAGVAARLRSEGIAAVQRKGEVIVNGQQEYPR